MENHPIIKVLPIGEFDTPLVNSQFEAIVAAFQSLGAEMIIAPSASDDVGVQQVLAGGSQKNPDLLLIVPLRGLSAQASEAAGQRSITPCIIWPVQGRFALPSGALATGSLREARIPVELFYAPPDHPSTTAKLQCLVNAGQAYSRLRRSRIGVVGGLFPNLVACRYDPDMITACLGVALVPVSYDDLRNSILYISHLVSEVERLQQEISNAHTIDPADQNSLTTGLNLHLALKQIARERELAGFAIECWSGLPKELGLNPCLGFIDDTYVLACEGDVMIGLGLLIARYLTGTNAYVGDLYDLDLDGILTLTHCGAPASLASNPKAVLLAQSPTALERGYPTMTCRPRFNPGRATVFRLYGQACDQLHLVSGEIIGSSQTSNSTVEVRLSGDRWDFLAHCQGNHYVVVAGDIRNELQLLAKWLDITIYES